MAFLVAFHYNNVHEYMMSYYCCCAKLISFVHSYNESSNVRNLFVINIRHLAPLLLPLAEVCTLLGPIWSFCIRPVHGQGQKIEMSKLAGPKVHRARQGINILVYNTILHMSINLVF